MKESERRLAESRIVVHGEAAPREDQEIPREAEIVPEELPILPLRGVVVYPHTSVPLTIGQPRSIKLVDDVAARDPVCARFKVGSFPANDPYLRAHIEPLPEVTETGVEIEAQMRAALDQFQKVADLSPSLPKEIVAGVLLMDDPLQVVYTIANYQRMDLDVAQGILEHSSTLEKLKVLNGLLSREIEILSLGQQIQDEARGEIEKVQREYFLREQLKAIQRELGEVDE